VNFTSSAENLSVSDMLLTVRWSVSGRFVLAVKQ